MMKHYFSALPRRELGADGASLQQVDQGLCEQATQVRHQQDPGHLRQHKIRPAAQSAYH